VNQSHCCSLPVKSNSVPPISDLLAFFLAWVGHIIILVLDDLALAPAVRVISAVCELLIMIIHPCSPRIRSFELRCLPAFSQFPSRIDFRTNLPGRRLIHTVTQAIPALQPQPYPPTRRTANLLGLFEPGVGIFFSPACAHYLI
jgi:hypothetical protein